MPKISLKDLLNDAVNKYLEVDNKELKTAGEQVMGLFSKQGEEGRRRAKKYKNKLAALELDENKLFQKVYNAASKLYGEELGSSIKLRARLMEALCIYKTVPPADITRLTNHLNQASIQIAACTRGHTIHGSYEQSKINAMASLLLPHINAENEEDEENEFELKSYKNKVS